MDFFKTKRIFKDSFRKKSMHEKQYALRVQMNMIMESLKNILIIETNKVRRGRMEGLKDLRAEERVKNAYSALFALTNAERELENIQTDEELASVIRKTGRVLAKVNSQADRSSQIGRKFFEWQADEMMERIEDHNAQTIKVPMVDGTNVSDDIVERLLADQHVEDCIRKDMLRASGDTVAADLNLSDPMLRDLSQEGQKNIDEQFKQIYTDQMRKNMI